MTEVTEMSAADPIRPDWIPAEEWRAKDVFDRERERLWPRVWQMACRETEIPSRGDFVRYDILDDSILVVRNGTGPDDIIAYYNVCQHRGRKLRTEAKGNLGANITCGFHGWQWTIDGKSKHVHFPDDWAGCSGFANADLSLPRVRVARWGGWVWINQDVEAEPLLDWLGAAAADIDIFAPQDMRPLWWKTIVAPVNWKVVIEAFCEGYHSLATHNSQMIIQERTPAKAFGRNSAFFSEAVETPNHYRDENGKWVKPGSLAEKLFLTFSVNYRMLFAMFLDPTIEAARRLNEERPIEDDPMKVITRLFELQQDEFAKRGLAWPATMTLDRVLAAGTDWHMFPNSICLPTVDGALWYRLRPHKSDPDQCIFDVWSFGRFPPGKEPKVENEIYVGFEAFRGQNPFLEEDFSNMMAVNEGMKCRGWSGARTNPLQEVAIVNFHHALREFIS